MLSGPTPTQISALLSYISYESVTVGLFLYTVNPLLLQNTRILISAISLSHVVLLLVS